MRNALQDVVIHGKFSFLTGGFKPGYLWWEGVDMLRKLCIVGLGVLFDKGTTMQAFFVRSSECATGTTSAEAS